MVLTLFSPLPDLKYKKTDNLLCWLFSLRLYGGVTDNPTKATRLGFQYSIVLVDGQFM